MSYPNDRTEMFAYYDGMNQQETRGTPSPSADEGPGPAYHDVSMSSHTSALSSSASPPLPRHGVPVLHTAPNAGYPVAGGYVDSEMPLDLSIKHPRQGGGSKCQRQTNKMNIHAHRGPKQRFPPYHMHEPKNTVPCSSQPRNPSPQHSHVQLRTTPSPENLHLLFMSSNSVLNGPPAAGGVFPSYEDGSDSNMSSSGDNTSHEPTKQAEHIPREEEEPTRTYMDLDSPSPNKRLCNKNVSQSKVPHPRHVKQLDPDSSTDSLHPGYDRPSAYVCRDGLSASSGGQSHPRRLTSQLVSSPKMSTGSTPSKDKAAKQPLSEKEDNLSTPNMQAPPLRHCIPTIDPKDQDIYFKQVLNNIVEKFPNAFDNCKVSEDSTAGKRTVKMPLHNLMAYHLELCFSKA